VREGRIGGQPRLRVAAAVTRGGKLLLVRHRKPGEEYFMLPGGGVKWGESMEEALEREVREETGLEVQAGRLLCVSETLYPDGSRHIVNLVFRGLERGGEIRPSSDARVEGCAFVDLGDLPGIRLYPPMASFLQRACAPGYRAGGVYLGRLWRD